MAGGLAPAAGVAEGRAGRRGAEGEGEIKRGEREREWEWGEREPGRLRQRRLCSTTCRGRRLPRRLAGPARALGRACGESLPVSGLAGERAAKGVGGHCLPCSLRACSVRMHSWRCVSNFSALAPDH